MLRLQCEKGQVVQSYVREFSQSYTNFGDHFSFSSCPNTCVGILGNKPREAPRAIKNSEVLENFLKKQLCSNVEN